MSIAKTSIARALKVLLNLQTYLSSKIAKPQTSEQTSDGKGKELQTQYTAYDMAAADGSSNTSSGRFELVAQFCLARDYRNIRRTRRYIYARAYQERLRAGLNGVMEFAVQNAGLQLEQIVKQPPDTLAPMDLKTLQSTYAS